MKRVLLTVVVLIALALGLFAAFVAFLPSSIVESRYPTLQAAQDDQLFERGWLPAVLPPSTHSIHLANNLDFNTSEGQFSFSPGEWVTLKASLSTPDFTTAPFAKWQDEAFSMRNEGYSSFSFTNEGSHWVFFCKPQLGYCRYALWPRQQG